MPVDDPPGQRIDAAPEAEAQRRREQRAFGDDQQTFFAEFGGGWSKQHPRQVVQQSRFVGLYFLFGFEFESPSLAFGGLRGAGFADHFISLARGLFDHITFGQRVAFDRISGDGPEEAALFAERISQQQCVGIEDLLLDLGQRQRLPLAMQAGIVLPAATPVR